MNEVESQNGFCEVLLKLANWYFRRRYSNDPSLFSNVINNFFDRRNEFLFRGNKVYFVGNKFYFLQLNLLNIPSVLKLLNLHINITTTNGN